MSDLLVGIDEACDTNGSRAILAALNRVNDRQEQIRTQLVQRVKELRDYAQAHLADALADVTMRGYTREQGKS